MTRDELRDRLWRLFATAREGERRGANPTTDIILLTAMAQAAVDAYAAAEAKAAPPNA